MDTVEKLSLLVALVWFLFSLVSTVLLIMGKIVANKEGREFSIREDLLITWTLPFCLGLASLYFLYKLPINAYNYLKYRRVRRMSKLFYQSLYAGVRRLEVGGVLKMVASIWTYTVKRTDQVFILSLCIEDKEIVQEFRSQDAVIVAIDLSMSIGRDRFGLEEYKSTIDYISKADFANGVSSNG